MRGDKFNRYFILSLTLHALALLLVLNLKGGKGGEGFQNSETKGIENAEVQKPPNNQMEVDIVYEEPIPGPGEKKPVDTEKECPDQWFVGIGVTISMDIITRVHPGYPADMAGLQQGDVIVKQDQPEITGELGTPIVLTIDRNGQIMDITVIRGKICYNLLRK